MNDEVLKLASKFHFPDENFRAVVYEDGSMALLTGRTLRKTKTRRFSTFLPKT